MENEPVRGRSGDTTSVAIGIVTIVAPMHARRVAIGNHWHVTIMKNDRLYLDTLGSHDRSLPVQSTSASRSATPTPWRFHLGFDMFPFFFPFASSSSSSSPFATATTATATATADTRFATSGRTWSCTRAREQWSPTHA